MPLSGCHDVGQGRPSWTVPVYLAAPTRAAALGLHCGYRGLAGEIGALQVNRVVAVKISLLDTEEGFGRKDAGVVDPHVDATEFLGRTVDVRASGSFSANSGNALINAARDAMGPILAPEWLVGPFLANGELVEVMPEHPPVPNRTPLYAVHPYQRFVPPKVKTLVDFLVIRYGKGYDWARYKDSQG